MLALYSDVLVLEINDFTSEFEIVVINGQFIYQKLNSHS